jgi:bacteriorhodopsin
LASGDGISFKTIEKKNIIIYREIYWARYVEWSITTPLIILDLALLAGLSGANILVAVVADLIFIATGLFAAYSSDEAQLWGWYAISIIAFLVIVYQIGFVGGAAASSKDGKTKAFYTAISWYSLTVWVVYPMYVTTVLQS